MEILSPKILKDKIDEYFEHCEILKNPPCDAGLAYHLGMTKKELQNFRAKKCIDISDVHIRIVEMARTRIEAHWESLLAKPHNKSDFWLKNQRDWGKEDSENSQSVTFMLDKDDYLLMGRDVKKELLKDKADDI